MTQKQITLRLPLTVIARIRRVAKLAAVTPTQVYRVMLALHMEQERSAADQIISTKETP